MRLIWVFVTCVIFATAAQAQDYDRSAFGSWTVEGCHSTRARLLALLHIGIAPLRIEECRVISGRWNGLYSGKTFTKAADVDIDHLIPLKWAWDHGARNWSRSARISFANNTRYLVVAEDGLNRSKSDKTPLEWIPPDPRARCLYITRFATGVQAYGFILDAAERVAFQNRAKQLCGPASKLFEIPQS